MLFQALEEYILKHQIDIFDEYTSLFTGEIE
jgi:hypothetical protein